MESALAARSTASSFRFGGWPACCAGAAGLLPAVPLESSRVANRSRTTSESLPPDTTLQPHSGLEVRTKSAQPFGHAKLGSRPRLCWPLIRIKRQVLRTISAGSLGQVAGPLPGQPRALLIHNGIGLLSFRDPTRVSKGISSAHHRFLETRKGVPTNWAGTPDTPHLDLWTRFAKGNSQGIAKFSKATTSIPVSGQCRCRTGSGFPPSPLVPWSRKSPLD